MKCFCLPTVILPSFACAAIIIAVLAAPAHAASPTITVSEDIATAGFYTVRWDGGEAGDVYVVEAAANDAFADPEELYRGPDRAMTRSGQGNGTVHLRVRLDDGAETPQWSAPAQVTVAHHPESRALAFFGIGLLVFVATGVLILTGALRGET